MKFSLPINEFEFDGICALLFPKLFPFGIGDPTKRSLNLIAKPCGRKPSHITPRSSHKF